MGFKDGFEKVAWFGKKKEPVVHTITKAHEKALLPAFKKHDALRKKENAKNLPMDGNNLHHQGFINAVAGLEHKSGIPNEQLYSHMYSNHAYDRKK